MHGTLRVATREKLIRWKKFRVDSGRKWRFHLRRLAGRAERAGLVDFVIAGAQKSGTTALDSYLRDHPGIVMAERKELHFFDVHRHFSRGPDYPLYHTFFDWRREPACYGEATPSYMYSKQALARLRDYRPSMRIIVVLRNPIDRAFSHWNMERDRGYEHREFLDALDEELSLARSGDFHTPTGSSYLRRGLYHRQLEYMLSLFPPSQVLALKYEDLRNEPQQVLDRVCAFLDLASSVQVSQRDVHSRGYRRRITAGEREILLEVLEPDIRDLEQLLGWDCSAWLA